MGWELSAQQGISNIQKITKAQQSRWLRRSRQALGLDVKSLAATLDVSPRTVNAWENESNKNLPSRDNLFHYMVLLFGTKGLAEPGRLIHLSEEPDSHEQRGSTIALSHMFVRLSQQHRLLVNVMIRTLYRIQRLLPGRAGKKRNNE